MAEFPAPQSPDIRASTGPSTFAGTLAYALFGLTAVLTIATAGLLHAPLLSIVGVIGVIIAYVKHSETRGTWLESHFSWLIRTFWWSLLWMLLGWVLVVTLIGIPVALIVWAATSLWVLYRVVRGWLALQDRRPVGIA